MSRSRLELDRARAQSLATSVRTRRGSLGLTQEALADRAGISVTHVQRLEGAQGNPTLATMYAVAAALESPLSKILPN